MMAGWWSWEMSEAWRRFRASVDLDEYDARWDRMAAAGESVHGEADFVTGLAAASVLDAGCGTGRLAIELARRGVDVVGVDADPDMLDRARRRAPRLSWVLADLARFDLGRRFDVVVLAGNVVPFVDHDDRPDAVRRCALHLDVGGRLVCGASLQPGWPTVDDLDRWSADAGLVLEARHAGWAGERWAPRGGYAVTVSRKVARPGT
jgi:SAM-dependent methyltransferase